VAGRFPLYADACVDGPVVEALVRARWNVQRGVDAFPEGTDDPVHFARAIQEERVLVSNDIDMKLLAETWAAEGRRFPGLVWWPRRHYAAMTPGDFVAAFEELAARDDLFAAYPIVHLKPKR
jgi:Domain of unknown function (DUF5615)